LFLKKEGYESPIASGDEFQPDRNIHPYLGYVFKPTPHKTNKLGFWGPDPTIPKPNNQINVLITGGSVAGSLFQKATNVLAEELKKVPSFSKKEIAIYCGTIPAYKQPQQLFALNYFILAGAQFDVVINLDGYNEVALPYNNNARHHVFAMFP
jgi:hypothetical protein